jgi:hypothetical protein
MTMPVNASKDGPDESFDALMLQGSLIADDLSMSARDHAVLRGLAAEVAALAARPMEDEKRELWRRHNGLERTRPLIFCDPENGWGEIITARDLRCESTLTRQLEMRLRKEIFRGAQMGDDYTIEPYLDIAHVYSELDWGLKARKVGGQGGGSYRWEAPVKRMDDLDKLHHPQIKIDQQATKRLRELVHEAVGGFLTVRVKTAWWWSLGMTRQLVDLRGLEQTMLDMIDNPELLHRMMTILKDGTMAMLDRLEAGGLLSLNNDGSYVGSGGLGWSSELPQSDFEGRVRTIDMWGFSESQETSVVSPAMFAEFIFPYQLPILERFGLNCYGCCESLNQRWEIVKQIPRLRRVSVSPWADVETMADMLGDRYIFSYKPNPADLAMDVLEEDRIRAKLREVLRITRGCHVEIIMKDNHTIRNDPSRVVRWVQIAREEAETV